MINKALAFIGLGLMVAVVIGLFRKGKVRECIAFSAYITIATAFGIFILACPSLYTPKVYIVKQGIYDTLLLVMGIELSIKVFAAFRGVADRVRGLLAMAVIGSTSVILFLTPAQVTYTDVPRYQLDVTTAGIWCLAFVALLIVWYQIPVPAFTRAIILGYVPYQVVFVVYNDLLGRFGWGALDWLNSLNAVAYDCVAAYWVFVLWQDEPQT